MPLKEIFTGQKHQQNHEYMMNIRQVDYNKQKMKLVSYPNPDNQSQENDEQYDQIDYTNDFSL